MIQLSNSNHIKKVIVFILIVCFAITLLFILTSEELSKVIGKNNINMTDEEKISNKNNNTSQQDEASAQSTTPAFKVLQQCLDKAQGFNLTNLGGRYYFFQNFTYMKSWGSSRKFCRQLGMDLVAIENEQENLAIKNHLNQNYGISNNFKAIWIGGTDSQKEGDWIWVATNQRLKYTNFHPIKMSNQTEENCLYASPQNLDMKWGDLQCKYLKPFLCELQEDLCYS